MEIKELCRQIDERKEELFKLLSNLIQINSENFGTHGNEEACARYVQRLCDGLGLQTTLYSPLDLPDFEKIRIISPDVAWKTVTMSRPPGRVKPMSTS